MIVIVYVSTTVFITQGNYVGYMFRLLNSHLRAYSLQIKSQDAVHTLCAQQWLADTANLECIIFFNPTL